MSAFIKASSVGLQKEPAINAVIDDATNEIIFRDSTDVSFAAATPKGLVVPVIRNVETMSLLDVSLYIFAKALCDYILDRTRARKTVRSRPRWQARH